MLELTKLIIYLRTLYFFNTHWYKLRIDVSTGYYSNLLSIFYILGTESLHNVSFLRAIILHFCLAIAPARCDSTKNLMVIPTNKTMYVHGHNVDRVINVAGYGGAYRNLFFERIIAQTHTQLPVYEDVCRNSALCNNVLVLSCIPRCYNLYS